ncbi:MAG: helix-turn-helix transcriptional regulator [Desulfotomaculales bacterium]
MKLHEKMSMIIKEKGWTHEEVARMLNVQRPTVTQYLRGRYRPSLETLTKFAALAGVSVDFLLNGEKEEIKPLSSIVKAEVVLTHADGRIERVPLSPEAQAMLELGRRTARARRKKVVK